MLRLPWLGLITLALAWAGIAQAQEATEPVSEEAVAPEEVALLAPEEVEALVAPIAFYPDEVLAVTLPAATYPLDAFFGLTITAVQIAGGLVVMTAGWRMLQQGNDALVREQQSTVPEDSIMRRAFFPLTMPLTVGPGTISVAITLGTRGAETERLLMTAAGGLLAALAVAATIYLSYRFATTVLRWLGETGTDIFMRLSAFILLCLGVQIVTNGVAALPFMASSGP